MSTVAELAERMMHWFSETFPKSRSLPSVAPEGPSDEETQHDRRLDEMERRTNQNMRETARLDPSAATRVRALETQIELQTRRPR